MPLYIKNLIAFTAPELLSLAPPHEVYECVPDVLVKLEAAVIAVFEAFEGFRIVIAPLYPPKLAVEEMLFGGMRSILSPFAPE